MHPLETEIDFRSPLEEHWAAFFELMGWRSVYVGSSFERWTADFVLRGAMQRILVEVADIRRADEEMFNQISRAAISAGNENDVLIVGAEPLWDASHWGCPAFGWLGEYHGPQKGHYWGEAIVHGGGGLGFCHDALSFHNRVTGYSDGDSGVGAEEHDEFIHWAWVNAGNAVQWQPDSESVITIVDRAVRKASRKTRSSSIAPAS